MLMRFGVASYNRLRCFYTQLQHRKWLAVILICCFWLRFRYTRLLQTTTEEKIVINYVDSTSPRWKKTWILDGEPERSLVPDRVQSLWTNESFECIGWQRTHVCDRIKEDSIAGVNGYFSIKRTDLESSEVAPNQEMNNLNCSALIRAGMAGYCAIRNRTSGTDLKLLVSSCESMIKGSYTCAQARDFSDFAVRSVGYKHLPTPSSLNIPPSTGLNKQALNGIVMIAFDKILPASYATIRLLRQHGCELPIEMWYRPDEMSIDNAIVHQLISVYKIQIRPIFDPRAKGFHVKPYAIYYSNFDNVLLLDGDNIPTKDPTYMFEDPEFLKTGAVFWPDYWKPSNSLFDLTQNSLLWEVIGTQFADMSEQESGQVLINRYKSKRALEKLMYYSTHGAILDRTYLLWGDKDLFRLAWLNSSQPFHFISRPPAVGGLYLKEMKLFCGLAILQHDTQGSLLFFHRNSIKLNGLRSQSRIITHIQEFSAHGDPNLYFVHQAIHAFRECCYYIATESFSDGQPATRIMAIEDTPHGALEDHAIAFSIEAHDLLDESNALGVDPRSGIQLGIHEIVIIFLSVYVALIMTFVWCKAKPARERLPSRFPTYKIK